MQDSPVSSQAAKPRATARTRWVWAALGVVWIAVVVSGLSMLWAYDNTPGIAGSSPASWPADTRLALAADRPTLVFLAHPQCTCSRASLGELAEVLARATKPPKTYVVFLKPFGVPENWEKTDLWRTATRLPNVTVISDDDGREAKGFGASTSGQTILYASSGALLFTGGITGARGHAGDNAGRASLVELLNRGGAARSRTDVFGCRLFASAT
jgi:hypothetical protein